MGWGRGGCGHARVGLGWGRVRWGWEVGWVGHARVGWDGGVVGWVGHARVGWDGVGCGVGHARGWGGGGSCKGGVGWVMQRWGGVGWVMQG